MIQVSVGFLSVRSKKTQTGRVQFGLLFGLSGLVFGLDSLDFLEVASGFLLVNPEFVSQILGHFLQGLAVSFDNGRLFLNLGIAGGDVI